MTDSLSTGPDVENGRDDTSPIDADELLDSLLGDNAIDPHPIHEGAPPTPPSTFEMVRQPHEPSEAELRQMPPPSVEPAAPPGPAEQVDPGEPVEPSRDRLVSRATVPELGQLELRQIAGLTSGSTMPLEPECYDFAQDGGAVGFRIQVDGNERAIVVPLASAIKLDAIEVHKPSLIGQGVLDAGSARFVVRHRREHKRPTDWLGQHDAAERPEPVIEVPPGLGSPHDPAAGDASGSGRRGRGRRRKRRENVPGAAAEVAIDAASLELIDRVRKVRLELTDRERYLHPDPAELADRAQKRAPILAIRPPGHPLFAKVSIMAADMPWMPRFDDIAAIPDALGDKLKPMMSLPSLPIVADLMVGPLGIVGNPSATLACARHVVTSLFGLSTTELRLHVATTEDRAPRWDWCYELAPPGPVDPTDGFPVVILDGTASLADSGLTHADAIEHRTGAVFLADSVEELPSYCATVLQVDGAGSGLLTNNQGNIIAGTPIGITTAFASEIADDLMAVVERRQRL